MNYENPSEFGSSDSTQPGRCAYYSLTILSFQRANKIKNKEEKMKLSLATHALLLLFFFTANAAEMKDENLPDAAQQEQVRGNLRKEPNYDAIVAVGTEETENESFIESAVVFLERALRKKHCCYKHHKKYCKYCRHDYCYWKSDSYHYKKDDDYYGYKYHNYHYNNDYHHYGGYNGRYSGEDDWY